MNKIIFFRMSFKLDEIISQQPKTVCGGEWRQINLSWVSRRGPAGLHTVCWNNCNSVIPYLRSV